MKLFIIRARRVTFKIRHAVLYHMSTSTEVEELPTILDKIVWTNLQKFLNVDYLLSFFFNFYLNKTFLPLPQHQCCINPRLAKKC